MTKTQVEHEIKLDVPEGAVVPDLTGLKGVKRVERVEVDLEATYFDTADVRLLRARTTLRRRTGGSDEGWHLKRPLVGDQRSETHLPLGRATRTVPAPLRRLVRVTVRDGALEPVATLRTHRTVHRLLGKGDVVLAEVCDDVVDAQLTGADEATSWREWEVELVEGDETLLLAAVDVLASVGATRAERASKVGRVLEPVLAEHASPAPAAGLKKSRAGAVVWQHLATHVARLHEYDPAVRADEPDAVHQMRVATRRLRSALTTFGPLLERDVTGPLKEELKGLGQVLGEARDAEVLRDRLSDTLADLDPAVVVGPVRRRLQAEDGYRAAYVALLVYLDSERYVRLLDALDSLLADTPWRPQARRAAPAVLRRRVRAADDALLKAVRRVDAATQDGPVEPRDLAIHEARKRAKKARYAAEAAAPALGKDAFRYAAVAEALQEVLGEHQDAVAAQRALRDLGVRAHEDGESAFTWGVLHGLEQDRAEASRWEFEDVWAEASRGRYRRWLRG